MILIRTDANSIVATGHLMRCLSVADALKELVQEEIVFCMADMSGRKIAEDRGYRVIRITGCWDDLLKEKAELKKIIIENNVSMMIIDSYYVCSEYFEGLSGLTKTIYIDDRNTESYDCDLIVNYSIYADEMGYYNMYDKSKLLLGAEYTPLRKQFAYVPKHNFKEPLKKVLILSGGTDSYNFLTKVTKRLLETKSDIELTVISGKMNKYYNELENMAKKHNNIILLSYVSEMAKYMCEADVAISACGTTIYELCACGTPVVGYGWTDNHKFNLEKYIRDNLMLWSGDLRDGVGECVEKCVNNAVILLNNAEGCRKMSEEQQKRVKGNGAMNMAEAIYNKAL